MKYAELAAINVNEHVEKKQNLSYLSWAWAVDQLLRCDDAAFWEYGEAKTYGDTMMVFCTVSAFGRIRTAQLPVMDHRNKSISNPDSFQVNVAMQRCLAKAIALHGIGLYIYAGEDIPQEDGEAKVVVEVTLPDTRVHQDLVDLRTQLAKDALETELEKKVYPEAVPPVGKDEAVCVDWIVTFMNEWLPSIETKDGLREFWKINKAALSRVKAFSYPMYEALETTFKQQAKEKQ